MKGSIVDWGEAQGKATGERRTVAYLLSPQKADHALRRNCCLVRILRPRPALTAQNHQTTGPAGTLLDVRRPREARQASGYVVIVPDYPWFGEHRYDFAASRGYASGSMKAVWDNVRAVDPLQTLPEVDPERVGVIG